MQLWLVCEAFRVQQDVPPKDEGKQKATIVFRLLKKDLKGIYHYWKYCCFFSRGIEQMEPGSFRGPIPVPRNAPLLPGCWTYAFRHPEPPGHAQLPGCVCSSQDPRRASRSNCCLKGPCCVSRNSSGLVMCLGPPARCPLFYPFFGRGCSPTKIDYREKGTLILTSLLENLVVQVVFLRGIFALYSCISCLLLCLCFLFSRASPVDLA